MGRGVISDLYQGEPILDSRLAAVGSGGGLAATIPPGHASLRGQGGRCRGRGWICDPGNARGCADLGQSARACECRRRAEGEDASAEHRSPSAGTDIQKDAEGKPQQVQVVNLLVTPDQAELLSLASNQTHIQLVLRNPLDTKILRRQGPPWRNLFADANAKPKVKPAVTAAAYRCRNPQPSVYLIEVFNGTKQSEEKFAPAREKNSEIESRHCHRLFLCLVLCHLCRRPALQAQTPPARLSAGRDFQPGLFERAFRRRGQIRAGRLSRSRLHGSPSARAILPKPLP